VSALGLLQSRRMKTHLDFDAVLFDLDGVLTATSALHAACWKQTFDEVLAERGHEPFDVERDYLAHVDGKPRRDGVRDFLRARRIPAPEPLVRAIAERKQALVDRALREGGVDAFPGSVHWVRKLREAGVQTAVVSSSSNAAGVLRSAGIERLFDEVVDGRDVERLGLRGKPAPDGFLEAAARLDVVPSRAIVVEDALAGVAAGRAGRFGLVIGVARAAAPQDLLTAGADMVVEDLAEMVR
jgi:alpha,alpha-trehalose phosphorylase